MRCEAMTTEAFIQELLRKMNAYWRAANYLSVGQIYLFDNPLLRSRSSWHVKPRLLGHWGTTPGLNFIYVHLNRLIKKHDLNIVYIAGQGMAARPGRQHLSRRYVQRVLSQRGAGRGRDEAAVQAVLVSRRHPEPRAPETPGSIHEGGELGYSIAHAYGAAFDNPDLLVCCVVGDGEAETGPLAASWHSNKFLNPVRDGAVLPILHLNGYKIANPTVLGRLKRRRVDFALPRLRAQTLFRGGTRPGSDAPAYGRDSRHRDRRGPGDSKGRAKPRILAPSALADDRPAHTQRLDGSKSGGREASGGNVARAPSPDRRCGAQTRSSEDARRWMKSYRPEELFDADGKLVPDLAELVPEGERRMGANLTPTADCC